MFELAVRRAEVCTLAASRFLCLVLAAVVALAPGLLPTEALAGAAATEARALDLGAVRKSVKALEQALEGGAIPDDSLDARIREAASLRTALGECTRLAETELARINTDIAAVQSAVGAESTAADRELKPLRSQKAQVEGRLAECSVQFSHATALVEGLSREQNNRLAQRLLAQDSDAYTLVMEAVADPGTWWTTAVDFVKEHSGVAALSWLSIIVLALLTIGGWFIGWRLRRTVPQMAESATQGLSLRLAGALLATLAVRLPRLCATVLLALGFLAHARWTDTSLSFIACAALALASLVVARVCVSAVLVPPGRHSPLQGLPEGLARALGLRIDALLVLLALSGLLFLTRLSEVLPPHILLLMRVTLVLLVSLNTAWLVGLLGSVPDWKRQGRGQRLLVQFMLLGTVVSELTGFHNLAWWLLSGLAMTLVLYSVASLVGSLFAELLDGLDSGVHGWQRRLRASMGLEADESAPGLIWLRLIVSAVTWTLWALLFLRIWGVSDAGMAVMVKYLLDGFEVGDVRIVPSQVLLGLVFFFGVSALVRAITRGVEKKVEQQRRMDIGAREALVKSLGYIGFAIAVLVGLSTAGVDFSSFAIVAGALSVGIGFGLQNVVNNFVSGLILLFERPIRTGDWIVVGEYEGIVKRISVRSTEVQTFDRGDVILPNADLISNAVKNYTLRDRIGRLKVPVGVAYGTDTEEVRRILLDAATSHPKVVKGGVAPAPWVWFIGFGESSLNFELVAFVIDVGERLTIVSDLNFAIERRLREAKIEIPFPQRDVSVRFVDPFLRDLMEPPGPPAEEEDEDAEGEGDGASDGDGDGAGSD
jgi:potassium-dependent mechanosensitive channel